jgi:hypothetical protein
MKKLLLITIVSAFMTGNLVEAQIDKTKLSLEVTKKQEQNIKILSQYTWKRMLEGTCEGSLVLTTLASGTIGPDGKPVYQVIDKEAAPKSGTKKQTQKIEYIKQAVELASQYIFMSTGQMVDLFNKGTLSEINNDMRVEAFGFIMKGDRINLTLDKSSLNYVSQDISTLMNGDPVKAQVTYKMGNDVNTVDKVTLNLPAKKISVTITNSEYAKKL